MIYLSLLIGFLKVGCFAFGGAYSAIALIRDIVLANGWLSEDRLCQMIAVSESTPGPIMVNLATYIGSSQGGLPGAIVATVAVVLPSFFVILLVLGIIKNTLKNPYVQAMLRGMKPCIIGIILATGVSLSVHQCFPHGLRPDPAALLLIGLLVLAGILHKRIRKKKLSSIILIVLSGLLGIILF